MSNSKRRAKVKFFKDKKKKWRWTLIASNGRKLCTPGESFSSKFAAEQNYYRIARYFNEEMETAC